MGSGLGMVSGKGVGEVWANLGVEPGFLSWVVASLDGGMDRLGWRGRRRMAWVGENGEG